MSQFDQLLIQQMGLAQMRPGPVRDLQFKQDENALLWKAPENPDCVGAYFIRIGSDIGTPAIVLAAQATKCVMPRGRKAYVSAYNPLNKTEGPKSEVSYRLIFQSDQFAGQEIVIGGDGSDVAPRFIILDADGNPVVIMGRLDDDGSAGVSVLDAGAEIGWIAKKFNGSTFDLGGWFKDFYIGNTGAADAWFKTTNTGIEITEAIVELERNGIRTVINNSGRGAVASSLGLSVGDGTSLSGVGSGFFVATNKSATTGAGNETRISTTSIRMETGLTGQPVFISSSNNGTITIGGKLTAGGVNLPLSSNKPVRTDSAGDLVTGNTNLATEVTGTLPVANGGTGVTTIANLRSSLGLSITDISGLQDALNAIIFALDGKANSSHSHSGTTSSDGDPAHTHTVSVS